MQRDKLQEDNTILLTNISTLFKTAQSELDRKAEEITKLRKQCAAIMCKIKT